MVLCKVYQIFYFNLLLFIGILIKLSMEIVTVELEEIVRLAVRCYLSILGRLFVVGY
jgi:hypothetical protein